MIYTFPTPLTPVLMIQQAAATFADADAVAVAVEAVLLETIATARLA
jgi:hypothetical protein